MMCGINYYHVMCKNTCQHLYKHMQAYTHIHEYIHIYIYAYNHRFTVEDLHRNDNGIFLSMFVVYIVYMYIYMYISLSPCVFVILCNFILKVNIYLKS